MKSARLLASILLLVLVAATACDCNDAADADADTRIDNLASMLPATSEGVLVVPELADLPDNLDYALRRVEQFQPEARNNEQAINRMLGFRITDVESWDAAGFDPDGSLLFSMFGTRPVLAAHVDDTNAFETNVVGTLRRQLETEDPIEEQQFGERSFRISGQGLANDMAWFYDDSMVVLILPPLEAFEVFDTGTATSVANKLGDLQRDVSLAESQSFADFRSGIGSDFPVSLYLHSDYYLDNTDVDDQHLGFGGVDTLADSLMEWSNSNADNIGLGFRAGDQSIEVQGFVGGDDEVIAQARDAYSTEQDVQWDGLLTENTTFAARTSIDLSKSIETFLQNLPDSERRTIERELSQMGRNHDMDIMEDVIGAFSGHSLLVFYGVGPGISGAAGEFMQRDIPGGVNTFLNNSGLLYSIHFADADKKDQLLDYMTAFGGDQLQRSALEYDGEPVDDIEVLQLANIDEYPIRMFNDRNAVTLATAGLGESSVYEYLTERRDEPLLSEAENSPLGTQFATAERTNGLYLNFGNLQSSVRELGAPISGYANVLSPLHELLMTAGVDDDGFRMSTELAFSDPLEDDDEQ